MDAPHISFSRALLGLILAPVPPAFLLSAVMGVPDQFALTFQLTLIFALVPAIVFGLPAIWMLRNKIAPRLIWAMLYGGASASIPWLFLALGQPGGTGLLPVGGIFALGMFGGAVFWLVAVWPALRRQRTRG